MPSSAVAGNLSRYITFFDELVVAAVPRLSQTEELRRFLRRRLPVSRVDLFRLDVSRWSWAGHGSSVPIFLPALAQTLRTYQGQRGEAFVTRVMALACNACTAQDVVLDDGHTKSQSVGR